MRLIVTGGGTGGHVFPALEVARLAISRGHEVSYFGSYRGQEKAVCAREGIQFKAFHSQPFYGLKSLKGLKSGWNLYWSAFAAKSAMRANKPDVVFSTGGYSSSPVISASRSLGVPYVILEQNSVPGRVNKAAAPDARFVATVFKETEEHLARANLIRTGMPIRRELREAATSRNRLEALVLVMGGSQGSAAINEAALSAALSLGLKKTRWLHIAGRTQFEPTAARAAGLASSVEYSVRPYLEGHEMAQAMASASLVVCRSGAGTLAELSAFRLPSVLIPLPTSHGGHQLHNAREFEAMGAATVLEQDEMTAETLAGAIESWLRDAERRDKARVQLASWDDPAASEKIMGLIEEAAESSQ